MMILMVVVMVVVVVVVVVVVGRLSRGSWRRRRRGDGVTMREDTDSPLLRQLEGRAEVMAWLLPFSSPSCFRAAATRIVPVGGVVA